MNIRSVGDQMCLSIGYSARDGGGIKQQGDEEQQHWNKTEKSQIKTLCIVQRNKTEISQVKTL